MQVSGKDAAFARLLKKPPPGSIIVERGREYRIRKDGARVRVGKPKKRKKRGHHT